MNRKLKFSILASVILIAISVYLISQQEIEPPPAILEIDGNEQISGIGSYCWKGTWNALCVDYAGIPTAQEPLPASSPFTAHLRLPLREPPYDLWLNVVRVKDEYELNLSAHDWRWWNIWDLQGKRLTLPLEQEQDIELSLEPGLYVLNIEAWWDEKGSVSYGFLVEVQANGTGAVPTTSVSSINQTLPSNVTTFPVITAIQPDSGTIGTKLVITGTGFTARDNNVAFRLRPEGSPEVFKVGYINNLISSDGKTIEFVVPELLSACAFPLSENEVCLDIGLNFKPGTHTYPVFVVNQNGTSNSVNFTVSR